MTIQQQQQPQEQQQQQLDESAGAAEAAGDPAQLGDSTEATAPSAILTLRLRPRPSVTWGADVINNEGMGKKSSKRECGIAVGGRNTPRLSSLNAGRGQPSACGLKSCT